MKKTIVFLSMSLVLILGLTSCGCQNEAAVDTTPPAAAPSTGADYNADGSGTVDGDSNPSNGNNGMMTGDLPAGNGSAESSAPGGNDPVKDDIIDRDPNATGDGALGDVGDAVDDLVDDARRTVR